MRRSFFENDSLSSLAGVCRLARVAFATGSSTLISGGTCSVAEQLEFSSDIFIEPARDETFAVARSIALTLNPVGEVCPLTETAVTEWAANPNASFNFADALNGRRLAQNFGWRICFARAATNWRPAVSRAKAFSPRAIVGPAATRSR
jgi:hypothetical protein